MDYRKIDAPLAAALEAASDPEHLMLTIFVSTTGGTVEFPPACAEFLKEQGIDPAVSRRPIFTATVSARTVAELSDQPWVRSLRLSQTLRPIGE